MKRVVIAGGGYAGVTLASALDDVFDVVLLDRRDRFYHNVGAMRAYADPSLFDRLLIPYSKLLRRGQVLQDEVRHAGPGGVTGQVRHYDADIVVVASGSTHRMPFKPAFTEARVFVREARALSEELGGAPRLTIDGDGPVAVELAGEIRARYPRKTVTLAARGDRLLTEAANPALGRKAAAQLREMGVEITYGGQPTADGLRITAHGAAYSVPCLNAAARVPVDARFQVAGQAGVYAIGDAADCGEPPLTFLARRQAEHLAGILLGRRGPYTPVRRVPMSIPLGPELGVTQLPLPGLPVAGSWITARLKGRGLFIAENWRRLGLDVSAAAGFAIT